jgi:Beta-lactamase class C and other penicillin binding proteins
MNHTSGLMGTRCDGIFRFDEKSEEYHDTFLKNLQSENLKANPGEFNCYCNDGFTLLEIIVERVSGMSFTEYMEEIYLQASFSGKYRKYMGYGYG